MPALSHGGSKGCRGPKLLTDESRDRGSRIQGLSVYDGTCPNVNCTALFLKHAHDAPDRMAVWLPSRRATTFGELRGLAARAQNLCRRHGLGPGDSVLLVDELGPRLYATVSGVLALGASVILVEPWMPVEKINRVISLVKPRLFLTGWLGRVWGLRVSSVRAIPRWVSVTEVASESAGELQVESVAPETPGIVTFTSGTTGNPKGVVRSQDYLVQQHEVISRRLGLEDHSGPDLTIFANFALANLASGRGSVIIPSSWKASHLRALDSLPAILRPESMTCGPAFLERLMAASRVSSLKSIHVGGALTDLSVFEKAFQHWGNAHFTHIYGSSEVEPVALCDAREAVRLSRSRGLFQTLHIGRPVAEIRAAVSDGGAWVAGPHVCPRYLGNEEENRINKRLDAEGTLWHFMGDRIVEDAEGWWYSGRAAQERRDFELEQRIYPFMESSRSFVHVDAEGRRFCVGEGMAKRRDALLRAFPELSGAVEGRIFRDLRHRARIDRNKSLRKAGKIS